MCAIKCEEDLERRTLGEEFEEDVNNIVCNHFLPSILDSPFTKIPILDIARVLLEVSSVVS